jgi:mycofactocin system glycosyltransferase
VSNDFIAQQPRPGHYCLVAGGRLHVQESGVVVVCDYPLRVVRLTAAAGRVLALCAEEHTVAQLAQATGASIKQMTALCEQLTAKGLLEAGPPLPPASWPPVSIIIPSYNRAPELERCLRSLFALDYPTACLEIIVVDDASTDATSCMLERIAPEAAARGLTLRIMRHATRQGVGSSRNTGANAARHDLLAYLDSDCVASQGWLRELVPAFQDARIGAVGGLIHAYTKTSLLGRYEDACSSLFMGTQPQPVQLAGPLTYLPTANLLVRRALWQQLGGFAALTQGEDVDFCRRLLQSGATMRYLPQGTVYHDYRTSWGAFLRTRVAYASAEAPLLQRFPSERRVLLLPPEQATFAAALLGGAWGLLWRVVRPKHKQPGAALPLLALLLALLVTLVGARKRQRRVQQHGIPLGFLAVLTATLRGHLAYTYQLCRHLTRYYTLPLLALGLLLPPLLLLVVLLCGSVIAVDYHRRKPAMGLGQYALCALLDDCAYEIGVVWGCLKQRRWQALWPVIKRRP